jgi:protein associated with RNAse G/E
MKEITYLQSLELIDLAAQEDRLYHHNGGQAYIRVSMDLNVLMIIDHTSVNRVRIELMDGTEYFKECKDYNWSHSKRLREHSTTMVEWYTKHTQLYELDLV